MTDSGERPRISEAADAVAGALADLFGEAAPGMVFAEPQEVGESVIVMAAAWERAGGFGFGGGGDASGAGFGGGGGGSSQGRPVAVIRIAPSGIEVEPIIDVTKIGITVLLALIGIRRALKG